MRTGTNVEYQALCHLSEKLSGCFGKDGDCTVIVDAHPELVDDSDPLSKKARTDNKFIVWSALLRQWSDVFNAELERWSSKEQPEIKILEFSKQVVEAFLRFMYSGRLLCGSECFLEVARMAEFYMVPTLKLVCFEKIAKHIEEQCGGLASSGVADWATKQHEFTVASFEASGIGLNELMKHKCFKVQHLRALGYSLSDLMPHFSVKELRGAGFTSVALKDEGCTFDELHDAGFSVHQLKHAGFGAQHFKKAGFRAWELKEVGFTCGELAAGNYICEELSRDLLCPFSQEELRAAFADAEI